MRKHIIKIFSFIIAITLLCSVATSINYNISLIPTAYAATIYSANGKDYYIANNSDELKEKLINELYNKNAQINIKLSGPGIDVSETLNNILNSNNYIACEVLSINTEYITYECQNYVLYTFNIQYITTNEQDKKTDTRIKEILNNITTTEMYTHQKVKAVNDYIVSNFKYDVSFNNYSDYDLLFDGKSVCNGYALLTYKMLNALYIPVELIRGTAKASNSSDYVGHAWNMVNIGGYWFNLDTTWNDPIPDRGNNISYNYYLKSDEEFNIDHIADNKSLKPSTTINYDTYIEEFNRNINNIIKKPTTNNINIKIHDSYVDFKKYNSTSVVEPFIENGRTLVPLRAVFSELGYNVDWDAKTRTATISSNNDTMTICPNDMFATINDKRVSLDVPARIVNGSIVVPVRFISEAFGNIVFWDNENRTVIIY